MKRLQMTLLVLFSVIGVWAQTYTGKVIDNNTQEPIIGATVSLTGNKNIVAVTDTAGLFTLRVTRTASPKITITYIGYHSITTTLTNAATYRLRQNVSAIGEVVVTAQESRGLTSASIIKKHAMEHLQPSSFTDLLELLPGGRSQDPVLNSPNTIRIRETGTASSYSTSSLGVSFMIDGAPISTNANCQTVKGAWETSTEGRSFVNSGVDMRSISTDDIESVEVVRGIPSVEYGDLTSGLVKIERKRGGNKWEARLKADMDSKLFYLAKGFEWKPQRMTLNLSADYLDAKADPRNRLENYKRISISARFSKGWSLDKYSVSLKTNLDYTGSFDNDKTDPELNSQAVDSYKSQYNRYAFNAKLGLNAKSRKQWFRSFEATLSSSYEYDLVQRTKLVQLSQLVAAITTTQTGESDGIILPYKYVASQDVEGKPFNLFAKATAKFRVPSQSISNTLLLGTDLNIDKNYGRGQIFDATRPLYTTSATLRKRLLSDIPANRQWGIFAEENISTLIGGNKLDIVAGVRAVQMPHLPGTYAMSGKFYLDPRVNIGWTLPKFKLAGKTSFIRISGGIGEHTKMPTISQLFPDPVYIDLIQLNYYHANADYRRINVMTYAIDPTNYALKPARNLKWEVSADFNLGGNRLSVTYFRENMTSGFRSQSYYAPYTYKQYNASSVDANTLSGQPQLDNMTYTLTTDLRGYSQYTNGSQTLKQGIEYTFSTKRFERIMTRLTINGAWFYTIYRNSQLEPYRPSTVIAGKQIQYVGYYNQNGGSKNQMLNTNFTVDTDIPKLKLGFSLSAQCLWYTMRQNAETSNYPVSYMDNNGEMHAWKDEDANDTYLRYLIRNYTASNFAKYRVPFSTNINFKVTKKLFNNGITIALFCNKLLDYSPSYQSNGVTIRRNVTPYFGLEMNVKI